MKAKLKGSVLWIEQDGETTRYQVTNLHPDPDVAQWAFRLTKMDGSMLSSENFDIAGMPEGPICECQDFMFRSSTEGPCKHLTCTKKVGLW